MSLPAAYRRLTHSSNKSYTFPFENRKNIVAIALSPDANVLLSIDEGMHYYHCIGTPGLVGGFEQADEDNLS